MLPPADQLHLHRQLPLLSPQLLLVPVVHPVPVLQRLRRGYWSATRRAKARVVPRTDAHYARMKTGSKMKDGENKGLRKQAPKNQGQYEELNVPEQMTRRR